MEILRTPEEARRYTWLLRGTASGGATKTVGLVPTMGALHEGHLSLVRLSNQSCDHTLASIFVNPTQFAPHEDLNKYPRTLERDCELLKTEGVSAVFVPSARTMYPEGYSTFIEPPEVAKSLEGVCRPDHFRGVATVVMKLLQCLPTTHAVFGTKDYQQLKVIESMVRDLNVGIEILAGETIRESDGLALSSRNQYLSQEQRQRALLLSRSLGVVADLAAAGEANIELLQNRMRETLLGASDQAKGVDQIDYAVVVDANTLSPLSRLDRPAVALVAARVGQTRLIDNRRIG